MIGSSDMIQRIQSISPRVSARTVVRHCRGFPKAEAKDFILKHENYNREYYTGFLGELNLKQTTTRNTNRRNVENNAYSVIKTQSNFYVNLRCMQLKDKSANIYVGGGITKDSNPEKEWEETVNKTTTINAVLS